ncbi:hypothetical protein [Nocardiopsis salina]|uniref:hypothetical protein n=1 Tax=Nocardiopsis salina TaxID=245836 RepID=UPI00036F2170|nr:hypothetical protein [Nocardiopsis salina]
MRENKDQKWNSDCQGDFLFWPLQIEMECSDGVALDHYVAVTGRILERFWDAGLSAVAACAFEHLLPWNGGIRSVEMPTPWVEHARPPLRMRWEWFDDLDFLGEFTAKLEGEPFTGRLIHEPCSQQGSSHPAKESKGTIRAGFRVLPTQQRLLR